MVVDSTYRGGSGFCFLDPIFQSLNAGSLRLHAILMKSVPKTLCLLSLALVSGFAAVGVSYTIAETFFFDRVFYRKSFAHGYWPDMEKGLEAFGERTKHLRELETLRQNNIKKPRSDSYQIAMIGDSFLWGQGVRFKFSVSKILEEKLNRIRETNIITLGRFGASIVQHLEHYNWAKSHYPVDLFVFLLVSNDAMPTYERRLAKNDVDGVIAACRRRFPREELVTTGNWKELAEEEVHEYAIKNFDRSWSSAPNRCVLDESLAKLPKEGIYFVGDDWFGAQSWRTFEQHLQKHQLNIVSTTESSHDPRYLKYWKDPAKYFYVSQIERHPSKLAHQMYADILYDAIVTRADFQPALVN